MKINTLYFLISPTIPSKVFGSRTVKFSLLEYLKDNGDNTILKPKICQDVSLFSSGNSINFIVAFLIARKQVIPFLDPGLEPHYFGENEVNFEVTLGSSKLLKSIFYEHFQNRLYHALCMLGETSRVGWV